MLGKLGCFIILQRTKPMVSNRPKPNKQKWKTANLWASRQSRRLVKKMIGPTSRFGIYFFFLLCRNLLLLGRIWTLRNRLIWKSAVSVLFKVLWGWQKNGKPMVFAFKELNLIGAIKFMLTRIQGILSLGLPGLLWSSGSMSKWELYCPVALPRIVT